ncbi:unnamed protein product [Lepeophtheirus salmonis]|uniref:(salmon louse) hypothetical protein n=1 Tax=Lepeophtheirus salmonis TaxID=72036 RepID=A0A7R8CUB2_LEPSM|nr:unnamed protein product [Lepeophtheirus salmonis]CAF2935111.1 unnamed protein product [Lepeophtheirus salmonis]
MDVIKKRFLIDILLKSGRYSRWLEENSMAEKSSPGSMPRNRDTTLIVLARNILRTSTVFRCFFIPKELALRTNGGSHTDPNVSNCGMCPIKKISTYLGFKRVCLAIFGFETIANTTQSGLHDVEYGFGARSNIKNATFYFLAVIITLI